MRESQITDLWLGQSMYITTFEACYNKNQFYAKIMDSQLYYSCDNM